MLPFVACWFEVLVNHPAPACRYIVIKEGCYLHPDPYSLISQINIVLSYVIGTMLRFGEVMINKIQVFSTSDLMEDLSI